MTDDHELEFIREFAVRGNGIGLCLSSEDRRERIRVAIMASGLAEKDFRDTGMTYSQAYRQRYGKQLEMRRHPRDATPGHRVDE